MANPKIILATDHAGFELKEEVKKFLLLEGYKVDDKGAHSYDKEDDYPDFIFPAAKEVAKDKGSVGIIFGGSGQGEATCANRIKGVRAAVYNTDNFELIKLSRIHNNANVLSIGARFVAKSHAIEAVKLWLSTDFAGEERHLRRIKKLDK
ncbi:MAG TPA: RpiB/LacA/LacB family sugar-phosphate isomerase [Candidatus Nanoarchaeia archaeon]|nr:RpiB/LacA/LacB family sugar-phosphate isomerase [Candidatus Nanoarchaeia archaeon]